MRQWPRQHTKPAPWSPGLRWDHPLTQGLVGYWPLWAGGKRWTNLVDGNDAVAASNPPVYGGPKDQYITLANSAAQTTDSALFDSLRTEFAVSVLICASYARGSHQIINKRSAWSATGIPFALEFDESLLNVYAKGNATYARMTYTPFWGAWAHLCGTWNGARLRLYVDAVEQAGANVSGAITPNDVGVAIGGLASSLTTERYTGSIAYAALWSRWLSAAEVAELYADPWGLITPPRTWFLGAGGFQPAWARNSNVLIGAGA